MANKPESAIPDTKATLDEWGWQVDGLCRDPQNAPLFFSPDTREGQGTRMSRIRRAKAVCSKCTVLAACRERGLRSNSKFGIWGGLTEHDRKALLKKKAPPAPEAPATTEVAA